MKIGVSASKTAVNAKYQMSISRSELRVRKIVITLIAVFSLCWYSKYSTKPLLIQDIKKTVFLTIFYTKI